MERKELVNLALFVNSLPRKLKARAEDAWEPKKLRSLTRKLEEVTASIKGQKYRTIKTEMTEFTRTMQGLMLGLSEKDLTKEQVTASIATLRKTKVKSITKATDALDIETKEKPHVFTKRIKLGASDSNMVDTIVETLEDEGQVQTVVASHEAQASDSKVIQTMEEFEAKARKLPSNLHRPFDVLKAPIIPIAEDFHVTHPNTLKEARIRAVVLEGYVILDDQLLLAIDEKRMKKQHLLQTKIRNYEDFSYSYIERILELVNEELSGRFKLEHCSEQADRNPMVKRKGSVVYVWVMPAFKFEALRRSAGSNSTMALREWDFPTMSKPSSVRVFENELDFGKSFRDKIMKLKLRIPSKQEAWVQTKKWLALEGKDPANKEYKEVFLRVWSGK